ncbi:hypothetical protein ACOMHN_033828 [Nucella lapillus]
MKGSWIGVTGRRNVSYSVENAWVVSLCQFELSVYHQDNISYDNKRTVVPGNSIFCEEIQKQTMNMIEKLGQ